jgi:hypothetical protein
MWSPALLKKEFLILQLHLPQIENILALSVEAHQWYRRTEKHKKVLLFFPKLVFLCPLGVHQCDASPCY